jgi:hypothetical protein
MLRRLTAALTLALLITSGLAAQRPQTRSGFWFHGGLGVGSVGCEDCDERTSGGAGVIALGGTLSDHFLLGGSFNGWARSEDDATLSVATVTVATHIYPWANGGFFITAGVGGGTTRLDFGQFSIEEDGAAGLLGLGYDIRIGNNVSLTPFGNVYTIKYDEGTLNVGQLGLAITVH